MFAGGNETMQATRDDLMPEALAAISPDLTLTEVGRLCEPPIERAHMSRLRSGHPGSAATWTRIGTALELARAKYAPKPRRGRRRTAA